MANHHLWSNRTFIAGASVLLSNRVGWGSDNTEDGDMLRVVAKPFQQHGPEAINEPVPTFNPDSIWIPDIFTPNKSLAQALVAK